MLVTTGNMATAVGIEVDHVVAGPVVAVVGQQPSGFDLLDQGQGQG